MKNNNKSNRLTNILLSLSLVIIIFVAGYKIGEYKSQSLFSIPQSNNQKNIDFSLFWDTWQKVEDKFVDKKKIDKQKMFYGAIKGMVASVDDPYTFFLTPDENKLVKSDLEGKLEGIGIQLGLKDGRMVIISPLKDSPADKAGIKAGDFINKVDGVSTINWTLSQTVSKIRGPKGTKVNLTINRSEKEFDVSIIRDEIIIKSVVLSYEKNVAVITVSQFGENTNSEWDRAVVEVAKKWKNKEIKGLVLDLRGNPGGYLESSVYLASDFFSSGKLIVKQESTTYGNQNYSSDREGRLQNIPLTILIDKGSASASEILSGALRDYKRGILVGEKSFGKGSVQEAIDLDKGAGLHVTIAKWILPKGDWINGKGITPDITVENQIKEGNTITPETDTQLQKAIEQIK